MNMRHIQLQAIVTFPSGTTPTHGPSAPPAWVGKSWGEYIQLAVDELNAYWEARGVAMRADFDAGHDVAFVSDDAVNDDDPDAATATDPNGSKVRPHRWARQAEARRHPGRAVVFFRDFDKTVADDDAFSVGAQGDYIVLDKSADETSAAHLARARGETLAHELGHYFHLSHTFSDEYEPATVADAADLMRKYIKTTGKPRPQAKDVFDYDAGNVSDTPPDPGIKLFKAEYGGGHRCPNPDDPADKPYVDVPVTFKNPDETRTYRLKPDMTNLMSYFNWTKDGRCPQPRTLSPDQKAVIERELRFGQRNQLLHTAAMMSDNGKAYFFKDDRYQRYDVAADEADYDPPKSISAGWPGLWTTNVDAAVVWPDGRCFFFKGEDYVKYDRDNRHVFAGYPKKIADHWPGLWNQDLDAAMVLNPNNAWFFKGRHCQRYDIEHDRAAGDPMPIAERWPGVWASGIDAALPWPNGKVYFCKGNQYARFDVDSGKVDQPTHRIEGFWPGLWESGVDAAVVWNDDTIRFFRGDQVAKYTILGNEVMENYPKAASSSGWKGFGWYGSAPAPLMYNGFDAAAVWNNGKAYFWKGGQYLRVDLEDGVVDHFPRPIADGWEGLGNAPIDAVVLWNNGKAYFFQGGEYIRYDIAADRADDGYPAGIRGRWWKRLTWDK